MASVCGAFDISVLVVGNGKDVEERSCAKKSRRSGGEEEVSTLAVAVASVDRYDPWKQLVVALIFLILIFFFF